MVKLENTQVWGFEGAIRGMRNPMNSWAQSDSEFHAGFSEDGVILGDNDLHLMQKLIRAGSEHRKFMRQIFVSVDITAPLYWWKEFDTYKVGTVANSCSTMHKIQAKQFSRDDFSHEHLSEGALKCLDYTIEELNSAREMYLITKDKEHWWDMIQLLPSSYNQRRTITASYENLFAMCSKGQRRFHKLDEWSKDFISWARTLSYSQELIFIDETLGGLDDE